MISFVNLHGFVLYHHYPFYFVQPFNALLLAGLAVYSRISNEK